MWTVEQFLALDQAGIHDALTSRGTPVFDLSTLADGTELARAVPRMSAMHAEVLVDACAKQLGHVPAAFLLALLESKDIWHKRAALLFLPRTDAVNRVLLQAVLSASMDLKHADPILAGCGFDSVLAAWAGHRLGISFDDARRYLHSTPGTDEREAAERGEHGALNLMPSFALFRVPWRAANFEQSEQACAACGRERGILYTGPMYGPGDNSRKVCPWCIADGTAAAAFDCSFNDATIGPLLPGTAQLPEEDQELVERRTPGFTTWQGNRWVMCCGRACVYLGQAEARDLEEGGRWAAAVEGVKREDRETRSEEERAHILSGVASGAVGVYVFECTRCGGLTGYWDCH